MRSPLTPPLRGQSCLNSAFCILHYASAVSLLLALSGSLSATSLAAQAAPFPDGPGRETFEVICSSCHSPTAVVDKRWTKDQWQAKVTEMLQEEVDVTEKEAAAIVGYLSATFPKTVNVNLAKPADIARIADIPASDAAAIAAYRQEHGAFKTVDDLKKVPGVDAARIDSKRERFEF